MILYPKKSYKTVIVINRCIMNIFQVIMLLIAAYFSYQVYLHINKLEDANSTTSNGSEASTSDLVQKADESFLDGEYKQAVLFLQEAYAKDPQDFEVLSKLGYVTAMGGNNEQALMYYNKALQIDPSDVSLLNKTASVYRSLKQYDKAKALLEKSISLEPNNKVTYFNYGNLLSDMDNKAGAVTMYQRALQIDPGFKEAKDEIENIKAKD